MGISFSHLLLILLVVLIVFGAGRLPKIMGDAAKGLKAFRDGFKEEDEVNGHKSISSQSDQEHSSKT